MQDLVKLCDPFYGAISDPPCHLARITFKMIEHIQARTRHARRGDLKNAFQYGVDYVLSDLAEATPFLLSRNRFNLWSLWDHRHGGPRDKGRGKAWFKDVLSARGFVFEDAQLLLLTQPDFLWFSFNPVSFWIAMRGGEPCAFVAEVNSTFGQRHCYFCAHDDFRAIKKSDTLRASKLMHVSPFQEIAGHYQFNIEISETRINIRIAFENADQGVLATLSGARRTATNRSLLWAAVRRPMGGLRVLALIYWQATILYLKRAPFLKKQAEPVVHITDSENLKGAQR